MEKILRNCLKVLLVMVISISALNLGLVSALEENEEEVLVNYDDQVSGIVNNSHLEISNTATGNWVDLYDSKTLQFMGSFPVTVTGTSGSYTAATLSTAIFGISSVITSIDGLGTYAPLVYSGRVYTGQGTLSNGVLTLGSSLDCLYTVLVTTTATQYLAASYNVSLRNVTGGSLSSTVSKASAGSTVTVTASPSTGYSLASATVSGELKGLLYWIIMYLMI